MSKIDIISGFLGAGKTTLIKKLLKEAFSDQQVVLIENEFGEIGIDGGFLKEAGIEIREMNSGCICCSLVGDFAEALKKVEEQYHPDRIIIEPSGVGKLSDVAKAIESIDDENMKLNCFVTVADAVKCKMYMKNFGEFYNNQIEYAQTILLSRTEKLNEDRLSEIVNLLKEHNHTATIITTPWNQLNGKELLDVMENKHDSLEKQMMEDCSCGHVHHHEHDEECCCGHDHHHEHDEECCCGHDHHHEHGEECCCGHDHHHEHDEECCCGHDHHHEHDEECCCGHDHHHEHDEECCCGHDHHHEHDEDCCCGHDHHHHHADDVFTSWGKETVHRYNEDELDDILNQLDESHDFGTVLRAKGIVEGNDGKWYYFDYVPGEIEIRTGAASYTGRICVIGSKLNEQALERLFGL